MKKHSRKNIASLFKQGIKWKVQDVLTLPTSHEVCSSTF
jgi:hypothetical protein